MATCHVPGDPTQSAVDLVVFALDKPREAFIFGGDGGKQLVFEVLGHHARTTRNGDGSAFGGRSVLLDQFLDVAVIEVICRRISAEADQHSVRSRDC